MRFSRRESRPDVPLPRMPRPELIDSRADNALSKHLETRRLIVGLIDLVPLSHSRSWLVLLKLCCRLCRCIDKC